MYYDNSRQNYVEKQKNRIMVEREILHIDYLINSILSRIDFEIDRRNVKTISNKQLKIMNQYQITCNLCLIKFAIDHCKYQNSVKILMRSVYRKRSDSEKCSKDS